MGKQTIFQKTILTGTMLCALGLGACSLSSGDEAFNDEWTMDEQATPVIQDTDRLETFDVACEADDCVETDDYLTNQFIQTQDDTIAVSRPAGQGMMSVRERQALAEQKKAILEANGLPGEKVMYSSTALPGAVLETSSDTETSVQVVGEAADTAAAVPAGMIPLKKVKTTITETTTKVKASSEEATEEEKPVWEMTLAEKIAYGEGVHSWEADSGNTLRRLLKDWGEKSGWTVIWQLDRDYRLEAGVIFQGTFTEVSGALIRSFARATPAPIGTFYQGNRVLVISTQEDENER
ncbi:MAG: TcpQ domain-containing protein [Alphaproteobacteria bacterium]|nr:TcpQ domain-containing protein [Alphaproteobacteria bacterium]